MILAADSVSNANEFTATRCDGHSRGVKSATRVFNLEGRFRFFILVGLVTFHVPGGGGPHNRQIGQCAMGGLIASVR